MIMKILSEQCIGSAAVPITVEGFGTEAMNATAEDVTERFKN